MSDILSYVEKYSEISSDELEFGEIDYLIFSQICHVNFETFEKGFCLTLREAGEKIFNSDKKVTNYLGLLIPRTIVPLFRRIYKTKRYADVIVSHYINDFNKEKEYQITAVVFKLSKDDRCIVFAGTGDCIVAWKENFMLLYQQPIEAQKVAAKYLYDYVTSEKIKGKVIVIGHSKGGNLAIYSSVINAEFLKDKLKIVYNLDGPGFNKKFYNSENYNLIKENITTLIPCCSVVGRLFEHNPQNTKFIASTNEGLFQHDLFSWKLNDKDLECSEKLDEKAEQIENKIKELTNKFTEEEQKDFVLGMFMVLEQTEEDTLTGLVDKRQNIIKNYFKLERKVRKSLNKIMLEFIKDKNLRQLVIMAIKDTKNMQKEQAV